MPIEADSFPEKSGKDTIWQKPVHPGGATQASYSGYFLKWASQATQEISKETAKQVLKIKKGNH